MKLVILFTVAALACAQVYAAPQIHIILNNDPSHDVHVVDNHYDDPSQVHVVDNNYNDPSQVHVVDNNYDDPSQVHVVDNNYNDPSQVHVVDNNYDDPSQVHVVDNSHNDPSHVHVVENKPPVIIVVNPIGLNRPTRVVEDTAFYRPTYGQNGGVDPGYYQPGNGQGAIDPGFYQPGNGQVVDPGFYRPGNPNDASIADISPAYVQGSGPNQYEPISNGPEFVEDGRKHYDNPNLRSGHY